MNLDEKYMSIALKEARKALLIDEVPVGAIIVKDNKIISRGYNQKEKRNSPLEHAEIIAIRKACKKLNNWRLTNCTIYVTVEPCIMCAGAIFSARLKKVVYGAKDLKGGGVGTSINIFEAKNINHHPEIVGGILENECSSLISNYFKAKRKNRAK